MPYVTTQAGSYKAAISHALHYMHAMKGRLSCQEQQGTIQVRIPASELSKTAAVALRYWPKSCRVDEPILHHDKRPSSFIASGFVKQTVFEENEELRPQDYHIYKILGPQIRPTCAWVGTAALTPIMSEYSLAGHTLPPLHNAIYKTEIIAEHTLLIQSTKPSSLKDIKYLYIPKSQPIDRFIQHPTILSQAESEVHLKQMETILSKWL